MVEMNNREERLARVERMVAQLQREATAVKQLAVHVFKHEATAIRQIAADVLKSRHQVGSALASHSKR